MDRPALLVLVRHAESWRNRAKGGQVFFTDENARKEVIGIPDYKITLTDMGFVQGDQTGVGIRSEFGVFDYVYHSGYERTKQTTDRILSAYSEEERARMKLRMNAFIRERDPGYTYEMTREEAKKAFPYLQTHWQEFGGFFSQPPGGESLAQVVQRVYLFLNMLFRDRVGQKVMVVTHGGTLRCFRFLLERWDYDQALKWPEGQAPLNCGVTVYRYNEPEDRLLLEAYNRVYYDTEKLLTVEPERGA
jgi:2,3-bisphosphoglycerate-dependent phosphoglycerate mutase